MSDHRPPPSDTVAAYRQTMRLDPPQPFRPDIGGGLGAGLLVVAVLVAIAILAAGSFGIPRILAPVETAPAAAVGTGTTAPPPVVPADGGAAQPAVAP